MTFQVGDRVVVVNNDASEWGTVGHQGTVVTVAAPGSLARDYDVGVEFGEHPSGGHNLGGIIHTNNGLWLFSSQLEHVGRALAHPRTFGEFIRKVEEARNVVQAR